MSIPNVIVVVPEGRDAPPLEMLDGKANFTIARTADELRDAQRDSEILFLNDFRTELLRTVGPGNLKWIHTSSIGVDALLTDAILASGLTVTTSRGVCEQPIAEWVLGVLIMFVKDLRRTLEYQSQRRWEHRETEPLTGRRVLLIGPGPVGREIATLLRAVGMNVDVMGRSGRHDPDLGMILPISDIDAALPAVDDLVLALPLNDSTRGLIDARRLSLMPSGARLVNVGRGALVDEPALIDAASTHHLSAVALDVFEQEPLPANHVFWGMDNVLVSPHMSGDLIGWRGRVAERFAENFHRWRAGEPLVSVVDLHEHGATASALQR